MWELSGVMVTFCILIGVWVTQGMNFHNFVNVRFAQAPFVGCKFHIRRNKMQTNMELSGITCRPKDSAGRGRTDVCNLL